MNKIKVVFLGTNGWYTTETGNTTCVLLESEDCFIILDAGNGIRNIDEYIKDTKKKIFLFLSHFHIDHISGLHILNKFKYFNELTVCSLKGGKKIIDNIIAQPHTISLDELPYKVHFQELGPGVQSGFPFGLECRELVHSSPCFGYRFQFGDKVISFCTDTGFCDSAVALSKSADLLITECAYLSGQVVDHWPHLNPEQAAKMAVEAQAKQLALMHFDAENYPTFADREKAGEIARKIFKNTIVAKDGMEIDI